MAPHIVVHHLENTRGTRVIWLLEELGLDYDLKIYPRDPVTARAPLEMRNVHPLGRSPTVEITDGNDKLVLHESIAIMEHLLDHYGNGRLAPSRSDKAQWLQHQTWMHYSEGGPMIIMFGKGLALRSLAAAQHPGYRLYFNPLLKEHLAYVESVLSEQPYFGGNHFSAADIAMAYTLLVVGRGLGPCSRAYVDKMRQRPAFQATLAKDMRGQSLFSEDTAAFEKTGQPPELPAQPLEVAYKL